MSHKWQTIDNSLMNIWINFFHKNLNEFYYTYMYFFNVVQINTFIILDFSGCRVRYPKEIFLVVHHPVVADHKIQRSTLPPWVLTTLKTNSKTKPVRNIFGKKLRLNKAKKLLNTPCVLLLYYCWCHLWIHIRADIFQNYFKVPAGIFEKVIFLYILWW